MLNHSRRRDKPSVLVADDHAGMLESVSRLLATDFQVVGAVSNGRQAVDAAQRLDPDVIVLDISMPELDGFQALREIRALRSRAPTVFLSMHGTNEYIATAFQSGAQGYVLKTQMSSDLVAAAQHALAGRLFVPSLAALSTSTDGGGHAAHFHRDDRACLDVVSSFVRASLLSRELVFVVGTEATRLAIAHDLQSSGIDVSAMERRQQYGAFDAVQSLAGVMSAGRPDHDRLAEIVEDLERQRVAFADGRPSRLIVFGEMAVPLCQTGDFDAALEIERTWKRLTAPLPILTVCSYPIECFHSTKGRERLSRFHDEHQVISHTLGVSRNGAEPGEIVNSR